MWHRWAKSTLFVGWLFFLVRVSATGPNQNYTLCADQNLLSVSSIQRHYNPRLQIYNFSIAGSSSKQINRMEEGANNQYYAAAEHTQIQYGLQTLYDNTTELCINVQGGCPITAGNTTLIHETISFSPPSSVPLGDIVLYYSAWDAYKESVTCLSFTPIGYQNPTWQLIFIFIPVAFALFAGLVALIASIATLAKAKFDILLLMSNYVHLPAAQRLMSPSFFDVIFHAQFVVTMGQLNLAFPKFYPLFTSNFSWSFLLFSTDWLDQTFQHIFPSAQNSTLGVGNTTTTGMNVTGTGMANFAEASSINVNGLFLTCIVFFLIIFGACMVLAISLWFFMHFYGVTGPVQDEKKHGCDFLIGIALRVLSLFYLPLMTMSFYQLMLPAPWYLLLASSLVLVFPLFLLFGYVSFIVLRVRPASTLYSDITMLLRYGSLYNTFKEERCRFFICILVQKILIGAMVGLFQSSGIAQVIALIIIEAVFVALHVKKWPFADKFINIYQLILSSVRLIIITFSLVHVGQFSVPDFDKQCIAYVQIALQFVIFIFMFILPVKNLSVMVTGVSDHELYNDTDTPPRMAIWRQPWQKEAAVRGPLFPHGYERRSFGPSVSDPRLSDPRLSDPQLSDPQLNRISYSNSFGQPIRNSMVSTHSSPSRPLTMTSLYGLHPHQPNRWSGYHSPPHQNEEFPRASIDQYQAYRNSLPPE